MFKRGVRLTVQAYVRANLPTKRYTNQRLHRKCPTLATFDANLRDHEADLRESVDFRAVVIRGASSGHEVIKDSYKVSKDQVHEGEKSPSSDHAEDGHCIYKPASSVSIGENALVAMIARLVSQKTTAMSIGEKRQVGRPTR